MFCFAFVHEQYGVIYSNNNNNNTNNNNTRELIPIIFNNKTKIHKEILGNSN